VRVPEELNLKLDGTEALELLAVVQATLNAIAPHCDVSGHRKPLNLHWGFGGCVFRDPGGLPVPW
jgi:hypothetical protein